MRVVICTSVVIQKEPTFSFHVSKFSVGLFLSCLLMKQRIISTSVWGAIVNFNTHASLKTRYKLDGQEFKLTDSNIHQTPVTIDIQASIGYKTIGFYVKYSPCKILDTAYGPEFSALSVGLVLF